MAIPVLQEIDMGSQKITSLATPTSANDAANKSYVDGKFVRQTVSVTTATLASNATENGTVALGKTFSLIKLTVSAACRIRLYSTAAFRTADASRPSTTPPTSGSQHGVIFDLQATSTPPASLSSFPADWVCSPEAPGSNADGSPSSTIYYAIQNLSGASAAIDVDFDVLTEEF